MTLNYSLSLNPNRCHYPLITYLRFSNAGLGIQTGESGKLKLESFAVLLPIDIVVSVKLFALMSLMRLECQLKIRRQMARALN